MYDSSSWVVVYCCKKFVLICCFFQHRHRCADTPLNGKCLVMNALTWRFFPFTLIIFFSSSNFRSSKFKSREKHSLITKEDSTQHATRKNSCWNNLLLLCVEAKMNNQKQIEKFSSLLHRRQQQQKRQKWIIKFKISRFERKERNFRILVNSSRFSFEIR